MSFSQSSKEAVIITFSFHLLLKETDPFRYFLLSFLPLMFLMESFSFKRFTEQDNVMTANDH